MNGGPTRAAVLAFALLPGVGAIDPRVGVDMRVLPWSAMGRLQVPGVSRCTAEMIDPHWAVTAAHCLGARVLGHVAPPSAVHLLLGYADGQFTRHLQPDAIRVDPAVAAAPGAHRGSDIALLHFAAAVSPTLSLESAPLAPGAALQLGGYGRDRAERLAVDPACRVRGYARDGEGMAVMVHDCAGTRGESGGALVSNGRLVGVVVAAEAGGAGGVAVPAATVQALLDRAR